MKLLLFYQLLRCIEKNIIWIENVFLKSWLIDSSYNGLQKERHRWVQPISFRSAISKRIPSPTSSSELFLGGWRPGCSCSFSLSFYLFCLFNSKTTKTDSSRAHIRKLPATFLFLTGNCEFRSTARYFTLPTYWVPGHTFLAETLRQIRPPLLTRRPLQAHPAKKKVVSFPPWKRMNA